jgi:hypothetical protein
MLINMRPTGTIPAIIGQDYFQLSRLVNDQLVAVGQAGSMIVLMG